MKLSETAERAIALARKVCEYYDTELPKWYPDYPIINPDQEGPPPPKEERELRNFLRSLSSDTILRLLLVMLLGREDFGVDDLPGRYRTLKRTYGKSIRATTLMLEKSPLDSYLADGLQLLKRHRIPVDDLPLEDRKEAKA